MNTEWLDLHGEEPQSMEEMLINEEKIAMEEQMAMNAPDRYLFRGVRFQNNCVVAVFWDQALEVYTSKGVNLEDCEFLGGFDDMEASIEDAFREVK